MEEEAEMKLIAEEYKTWKKNTPFLYDFVLVHALEWPSLTVEWLPDNIVSPENDYCIQRLILGTLTNNEDQNTLMFAEVRLPIEESGQTTPVNDGSIYGGAAGKLEIVQEINVEAEVNRARHMPQNSNLIACHTGLPDILVFDRTRHPSKAVKDGQCNPDLRLKGHKRQGYGLAWNTFNAGQLLSSADDKLTCLFDTNAASHEAVIEPLHTFYGHTEAVEDVAWHPFQPYVFGTVGDDRRLMLWDTRSTNFRKPMQSVEAHRAETNCIAFNPLTEYLILTGAADKTVALWDQRCIKEKLHSFESHTEQVFNIAWAPFSSTVFASGGGDRRVSIWDIKKIGMEQKAEDAEDGPPELLFLHGGHTDNISDFNWNPHIDWTISSVGDNNVVQIWKVAECIYSEDVDAENSVPDEILE